MLKPQLRALAGPGRGAATKNPSHTKKTHNIQVLVAVLLESFFSDLNATEVREIDKFRFFLCMGSF